MKCLIGKAALKATVSYVNPHFYTKVEFGRYIQPCTLVITNLFQTSFHGSLQPSIMQTLIKRKHITLIKSVSNTVEPFSWMVTVILNGLFNTQSELSMSSASVMQTL